MVRCLNCMEIFDETFGVCPRCGFIPGTPPKEAYHLNPGTVLRERYVVGTTVGFGGFGITYRAWDKVLDKKVAVKEFYPNGIVNRIPGEKEVIIYSGKRANEFQNGKVRFLAEARNMAQFSSHPNIVNVYDFFEENHTAYIAMEFLEGVSYKQYIAANGGMVDVETAVNVALSVLDALKEIHRVKIIHRDISPDNIFMVPEEAGSDKYKVKLIDFGAARFASGEEEKTLSIILKPGYAPPEQYRTRSRQGPWTDIYAVGAVLYRSITGKMPDESVNRMVEDHVVAPNVLEPELPQHLSDCIMRAIALNQELRFQNVDQFRDALQNQTKVLGVSEELKRRKFIRGIRIAGICVVLLGAALACSRVYQNKQGALYNIEASISIQMPAVNEDKVEEVRQAAAFDSKGSQEKIFALSDSSQMLEGMVAEYTTNFQKVTVSTDECEPGEEYKESLKQKAIAGDLPSVFDSSGITSRDTEIWQRLGTLDTTYDTLDLKNYYFMQTSAFQDYFMKEKKQVPLSICAPVLYVNTYMIPETEIPDEITSLQQLVYEGKPSYCISTEDAGMYRAAFGQAEEAAPVGGTRGSEEKGYEPFLRREAAYYLGNTDDYEAVRASLGGIYKMVVLETLQKEGKVKGRFKNLWSIDGSLEGEEKTAADSLVYYLLGENAQDVFNLQNSNGLSLNRKMMETYVSSNDEFKAVANGLDSLEMEYGEEPES